MDDLELQCRYEEVFQQYVTMAPELAKALEKFGRIRNELGGLVEEMQKRKLPTDLEYPKEQDAP
jgi:hypothetical protein